MINRLHKQAALEALGTGGLVLAVLGGPYLALSLGATKVETTLIATFAVVAAFVAVLYAIGSYTGGRINPAVSLSMFVTGRISALQLGLYALGQLVGAAVAAVVANAVWEQALVTVGDATAGNHALVAEAITAFALVGLIHGAVLAGNSSAVPLLIPAVIAAAAFAAPLGIANPAVTMAVSLIGGVWSSSTMVLLIVIELAAGTVAGLLMRVLYEPDPDPEPEPDRPDTAAASAAA